MSGSWIVSCNISAFDIVSYLSNHDTVVVKRTRAIEKGDTVYLYAGKPYSEILYKCKVINSEVDEALLEQNKYAINDKCPACKQHYMLLQVEGDYERGTFGYSTLREHGVGQFQNPTHLGQRVLTFLSKKEPLLRIRRSNG